MGKLLFLILLSSSIHANAMDFDAIKKRLRSHMAQMLGEENTEKVFGKNEKKKMRLPAIPEVKNDATSTKVYQNKNRELEKQGDAFNKLGLKVKRKYRIAFIQELYQATRNAEAQESDVITYLNVLEQGGSREGVYRAITLDSVYASLESYEESPTKELQKFVIAYGEKYLARRFDQTAMAKLNLWSIKRIIVEKTLEMMDVMADKPQDLRVWFAVLSAELAQKFPSLWKNQVRKNTDENYHLAWAKQAPFQHIKSETIIKLNKAMNSLNQEK